MPRTASCSRCWSVNLLRRLRVLLTQVPSRTGPWGVSSMWVLGTTTRPSRAAYWVSAAIPRSNAPPLPRRRGGGSGVGPAREPEGLQSFALLGQQGVPDSGVGPASGPGADVDPVHGDAGQEVGRALLFDQEAAGGGVVAARHQPTSRPGEDVVGADAAPDDVRCAGTHLGPVLERGASCGAGAHGPGEFVDARGTAHALDP